MLPSARDALDDTEPPIAADQRRRPAFWRAL